MSINLQLCIFIASTRTEITGKYFGFTNLPSYWYLSSLNRKRTRLDPVTDHARICSGIDPCARPDFFKLACCVIVFYSDLFEANDVLDE